jgi:hypothetical protein
VGRVRFGVSAQLGSFLCFGFANFYFPVSIFFFLAADSQGCWSLLKLPLRLLENVCYSIAPRV